MKYLVEVTDTYGGEANYSWVRRLIVSGCSTPMGAARKVAKRDGNRIRKESEYCDVSSFDVVGSCVRYIVFDENEFNIPNWQRNCRLTYI